MTRSGRNLILSSVFALLALTLLGGCTAEPTSADIAAEACDASVRERTRGKPYSLDLKALAASMAVDSRGEQILKAPIVVNAGLADQVTQSLECAVRLSDDQTSATVLNLRFIW